MLLKKLESFFLLLTFGLFLFSCTVEEKKVQEKPFVSTECDVSIEVLGTDSITYDRLVFEGTIDGNPIYIPDNLPKQDIKLGMGGTLEITVKAVDVNDFTLADGSAKKEITESTNIEIRLNPKNPSDDVYLTFVNDLETLKLAYAKGEEVDNIAEPKKDGYTFGGWFTEPNGQGTQLQLGYKMDADITVYAFWKVLDPNTKYTVTFETNGGSAVSTESVKAGETIAQPTDPTKADHTFVGWCSDSSLTKLVNFPYTVNANVTLYAKWVVAGNEVKVTGVKLDKTTATAKLNYAIQLTHFIEPTNATNKSVTWTSSNPSVASVSDGKVTGLSAGTATITVTTADGGFTATCTVTVSDGSKTLSYLTLAKAASSSETAPAFTVTAKYSDRTTEDVTSKATWKSSDSSVATVSSGIVTLVAAGSTDVTASHTVDGVTKESNKATLTVKSVGGSSDSIYLIPGCWDEASAKFAAYFWDGDGATNETVDLTLDSATGYYICTPSKKWANAIFKRLSPTGSKEAWDNGAGLWNQTKDLTVPGDSNTYEISGWESGSWNGMNGNSTGGTLTATVDVETPTIPEKPTVNMNPAASGEISLKGNIVVDYVENNASVTAASVIISGAVSKTYSLIDFSGKKISISVEKLGLTAGATITVIAEATNSEGTTSIGPLTFTVKDVPPPPPPSKDTFTWDNANVYFVIQDRFYDGDSSNNNSYGRMSTDDLGKKIGTFHGGDIKGLTQKLDYLDGLGINAIWVTALYEQAHGWCGGGSNGDFAHYAYHGYYPLDYTMMDKNMGTVEEFRTFVTECHKRGIRVVMDVVMNHTGYLTLQDCQDYGIDIFKGSYSGGKSIDKGFKIGSDGSTYHDHHNQIDYDGHNDGWAKWWGASWIRAGVPGYTAGGGDDLTKNLDNLPDVKTESSNAQTVAPILQTKWAKETSGYDDWIIPAAKSLRSTSATDAPVVWIEKWLAAWVEEFGIDGFRCDTAKHIDVRRWGELKALCKTALAKWRASDRVDQYAKDWDEDFWMTGECFGWRYGGGGPWFNEGGFDTMIDFSANGGSFGSLPSWDSRTNNKQGLLYISSHDTSLGRSNDQQSLGTQFVLMPGPIQIYYGDETSRKFGDTGSDPNQGTRSDFDWGAASGDCAKHWGKVGNFRKYNPAVGAGTGSGTKRTYNDSKVAIGTNGSSVDVSGLFTDGTTVYNWYDGKSATVSGGKVTFDGGSMKQPILVSDRDPASYGVTF